MTIVTPPGLRPIALPPLWLRTLQNTAAKMKAVQPRFIVDSVPAARTVPYSHGLYYGIGVDGPSGTALNVAVTGATPSIPNAGGGTVSYMMNELTSEEHLQAEPRRQPERAHPRLAPGAERLQRHGRDMRRQDDGEPMFIGRASTHEPYWPGGRRGEPASRLPGAGV